MNKVDPDLVVRHKVGKVNSVRYDQINAMLVNEWLKEHKKVETQQVTIDELKSKATKEEATIAELEQGMGGSHCATERAGRTNSTGHCSD